VSTELLGAIASVALTAVSLAPEAVGWGFGVALVTSRARDPHRSTVLVLVRVALLLEVIVLLGSFAASFGNLLVLAGLPSELLFIAYPLLGVVTDVIRLVQLPLLVGAAFGLGRSRAVDADDPVPGWT
jgi:hypothetical protein